MPAVAPGRAVAHVVGLRVEHELTRCVRGLSFYDVHRPNPEVGHLHCDPGRVGFISEEPVSRTHGVVSYKFFVTDRVGENVDLERAGEKLGDERGALRDLPREVREGLELDFVCLCGAERDEVEVVQ